MSGDPITEFRDAVRYEISSSWERGFDFGHQCARLEIHLDNRGEATTTEVAALRRKVAEMVRRENDVIIAYRSASANAMRDAINAMELAQ